MNSVWIGCLPGELAVVHSLNGEGGQVIHKYLPGKDSLYFGLC